MISSDTKRKADKKMKGYVIAMANEAECLMANLVDAKEETLYGRRVVRGKLHGEDVMMVVSGIGKVNAGAATQLAIMLGATEIISVGVAGGLDKDMNVGDIYEISEAVQYDFDLSAVNGTMIGTLDEYSTPYIPMSGPQDGRIIGSGDRFNDSAVDNDLMVRLGVTIRDMECAAVAHVCQKAGIPCKGIKCISDVRGKGAMTGQYVDNLKRCLAILTEYLGKKKD